MAIYFLNLIGFIIDLEERVHDIFVNIMDVLLMTVVFFGMISVVYFIVVFVIFIGNYKKSRQTSLHPSLGIGLGIVEMYYLQALFKNLKNEKTIYTDECYTHAFNHS